MPRRARYRVRGYPCRVELAMYLNVSYITNYRPLRWAHRCSCKNCLERKQMSSPTLVSCGFSFTLLTIGAAQQTISSSRAGFRVKGRRKFSGSRMMYHCLIWTETTVSVWMTSSCSYIHPPTMLNFQRISSIVYETKLQSNRSTCEVA